MSFKHQWKDKGEGHKSNKWIFVLAFLLTLFAASFLLSVVGSHHASAQTANCTVPQTNYGVASSKITVPTKGSYQLWTRMLAPDTTNNAYMLEITGVGCYTVGGASVKPSQWTWVNYQNDKPSAKILASLNAGTYDVRLIGTEPNVKIDRVLAVFDGKCTAGPANFGDNCLITEDATLPIVSITSPAKNSTATGTVKVNATASDQSGIAKMELYIDGELTYTSTKSPLAYNFDTTLYDNGTHSVTVQAYDTKGNSAIETISVTVKNGDTSAPAVPVDVKAAITDTNKVTVTWSASNDNVAVTGYTVFRDNEPLAKVTNGLSYVDTTAVQGGKYLYTVTANDAANNHSAHSSPAAVTMPSPSGADTQAPTEPTDLTASAILGNQLNLTWKASRDNVGVSSYDVYRISPENAPAVKIASITGLSFGDTGLKTDSKYTYYVIARDASGNSSGKSNVIKPKTGSQASIPALKSVIKGRVFAPGGAAAANVQVVALSKGQQYTTTTNAKGDYQLSNLPTKVGIKVIFKLNPTTVKDTVLGLQSENDVITHNVWF